MSSTTSISTSPIRGAQDLALLLARAGLGVVLVTHGWQKQQQGISATAEGFRGMGIPAAEAAAWFATYVELAGGVLLIAGLLTPLVGLLVAGNMAGAAWFAHRDAGVLADGGGWELVGVIGLLGLVLAATGAGRLSVDHLLLGRRLERRRATAADVRERERVAA